MNNVQIMSTSPQAGSVKANVKSASKVTSAKSASKSTGFDDVLEKSQTQADTKSDVQAKDTATVARDASDAAKAAKDAAAEAKDARDAAAVAEVTGKSSDADAPKKTAKTGKDAKDTTVKDDAADVSDAVDEALAADVASTILAAKLNAAQTLLLGEMKSLVKDAMGTAKGPLADTVEDLAQALIDASTQKSMAATSNLMSLIPQDASSGKAQQAMLAMLSGQNTAAQDAKAALASLLANDATASDVLANVQNLLADAAAAQTPAEMTANARTAATQNAFASLQSLATPVIQQTATQTTPLFANLKNTQPQTDAKATVSDFANLLGTDVETTAQSADLGQQVLNAFQQQAGANADAQQQGAQQQTFVADGGETVTQLPEEAAFDKAPATQEAAPTQTAPLASFSQTLQNIDGTKQSAATQTAQQPQTDYDIPQQIVDQARLIQRGQDTEMVIHLKPEHLGDLTLRVSVGADGAVNASFHSNNAEVRTIIENTLVQLKQDLNNQGLKVDNVGVYAGLADGGLP
ncbi:flagellar hook-length control protein FliK, partial [Selenomonas sp.]|uniref:flagellar hook-length control protein FliK n=1 Tax=Selenomonas sp. TaxID=2053611 RepID=UPI002A7F450F